MTSPPAERDHYSYAVYGDPEMARSFDGRRFGGPIGELVASKQAVVLTRFAGNLEGRSVLDVGTGTGRAALLYAQNGARVTGVDASAEMLAVARRRAAEQGATVSFALGDAHSLEFADRAFDVAISLRVLMHAAHWRTCLSELCRTADDLVIFDYPALCSCTLFHSLTRRTLYLAGRNTEPYRVIADRSVRSHLARCGFRVKAMHRQFVIPIALHKMIKSRPFTEASEAFFERIGLLSLVGSPVTVVAERCSTS